jgi:Tol biopolymer transport system component
MNADGSGARILTHESGDAGDGSTQWSPDGRRLVFEVSHGFGKKYLTTIGSDGKGKHRLRAGFDPDWSANGKLIVFSDVAGRIATVRADGRGLHRLTHTGCADNPRWSPDGKKIVFLVATGCYDPPRIAVMRANGKVLRKITAKRERPRWIGLVDWSPDGRKIVFSAGREFPVVGNIYVMNAEGSHRQQLTSSGDAFDPSWQPA